MQGSDIPSITVEDFDHKPEGVKYANNFDIWKNINAMLHGSLSMAEMAPPTAAPPDQSKRELLYTIQPSMLNNNLTYKLH